MLFKNKKNGQCPLGSVAMATLLELTLNRTFPPTPSYFIIFFKAFRT